tara:strand:- start:42 stop:437 length:396 start_codon:yes stop_codon:yes gene_type:complete
MKAKKKYKKGGVFPPAIQALKRRAAKKESPIYGGVLDEATVTSTRLPMKGKSEVISTIADDLTSKFGTTGFLTTAQQRAFNLIKKSKHSKRAKAIKRIIRRTSKVGGAIVAPPMLFNPMNFGEVSNEDNLL